MRAEVRLVTPELAKQWLRNNDSNRTLRPQRVKQYATDMINNRWHLTGQGITFGIDGNLLDGQHRLNAIILADKPVELLVVTDAEVCGDYDGNLVRGTYDKFKMLNKPNVPLYSGHGLAAVRLIYLILNEGGKLSGKQAPTFEELSDFIDKHYHDLLWITDVCSKGKHGNKRDGSPMRGLRHGIIGATLFSVYAVEPKLTRPDVEHIIHVLKTGLREYDYDASVIAMRNKLITTMGNSAEVNEELFLRLQYMCKQYINRKNVFRTIRPKENIFDFTTIKRMEEN